MFSSEQLNSLLKEVLGRMGGQDEKNRDGKKGSKNSGNSGSSANSGNGTNKMGGKATIAPSEALVIAGILGGVLEVTSVLVDNRQIVQIVLSGSLKQKTQLEKIMDQVGAMPFEDVMRTMLDKLTH